MNNTTLFIIAFCLMCISLSASVGVYFAMKTTPTTPAPTTATTPAATTPAATTAIAEFKSGSFQSTQWDEEGGGNAVYLDRHNINCLGKPLNQMHLSRKGDGKFRYDFTCSSGGALKAPENKTTPWNEEGGGNAIYLDRHDVDCGSNSVITQIQLGRKGDGNYRYAYTCAPSSNTLKCRDATTPLNDEGGGNSIYLDRHDIKCNSDEVLSRIHLARNGKNQYQYEYRCCKN